MPEMCVARTVSGEIENQAAWCVCQVAPANLIQVLKFTPCMFGRRSSIWVLTATRKMAERVSRLYSSAGRRCRGIQSLIYKAEANRQVCSTNRGGIKMHPFKAGFKTKPEQPGLIVVQDGPAATASTGRQNLARQLTEKRAPTARTSKSPFHEQMSAGWN